MTRTTEYLDGARRGHLVALGIFGTFALAAIAALIAGGWYLDEYGDPLHGPNACNATTENRFISDALPKQLATESFRSLMPTGADCDDRSTGSVAAAWSATAQPGSVADQLLKAGWMRLGPADGTPSWYDANEPDGSVDSCLTDKPDAWQQPGRDEYPTPSCNLPLDDQIVLTTQRGPRIFVARLGPVGLTIDAAHKRDKKGVEQITTGD